MQPVMDFYTPKCAPMTETDDMRLVQEYNKRKLILTEPKRTYEINKAKAKAWIEILNAINANNKVKRNKTQLKERYKYLMSKAKRKSYLLSGAANKFKSETGVVAEAMAQLASITSPLTRVEREIMSIYEEGSQLLNNENSGYCSLLPMSTQSRELNNNGSVLELEEGEVPPLPPFPRFNQQQGTSNVDAGLCSKLPAATNPAYFSGAGNYSGASSAIGQVAACQAFNNNTPQLGIAMSFNQPMVPHPGFLVGNQKIEVDTPLNCNNNGCNKMVETAVSTNSMNIQSDKTEDDELNNFQKESSEVELVSTIGPSISEHSQESTAFVDIKSEPECSEFNDDTLSQQNKCYDCPSTSFFQPIPTASQCQQNFSNPVDTAAQQSQLADIQEMWNLQRQTYQSQIAAANAQKDAMLMLQRVLKHMLDG